MIMKKISKATKGLIAASFLIGIIAIITPVMAASSNRVLFMAIGDDLDINATNLIVGKMEFDNEDELISVNVVFHQRIYDESGKKVYTMMGMLKDGFRMTKQHYFLCPIYGFWFINVWLIIGDGLLKTTDTNYLLTYRNIFEYFPMPNTEGKFVNTPMLMLFSPTGEYCLDNPETTPPGSENPVKTLDGSGWVLIAALWDVGIPVDVGFGPGIFPVGPISHFTRCWGI